MERCWGSATLGLAEGSQEVGRQGRRAGSSRRDCRALPRCPGSSSEAILLPASQVISGVWQPFIFGIHSFLFLLY